MEIQRPGSQNPPNPVVEELVDSMRFLNGAVVNSKLYHLGHPEMMRALQQFVERINATTSRHGPIALTPGFDGLKWRGTPVTHESDEHKSLGQFLHREGIEQIAFEPGLTEAEAYRLVSVLRINFTSHEYEEETLDSLLWQAELECVKFGMVKELMEAEALSGRDGMGLSEGLDRQLWHTLGLDARSAPDGGGRRHISGPDTGGFVADESEEFDFVLDAQSSAPPPELDDQFWTEHLTELKAEDLEVLGRMRAEVAEESETDFLVRLITFLLRVALARRREFPPVEVQRFADEAVEQIYAEIDAASVVRVVNDGRRFFSQIPDYDDEGRQFVRDFFTGVFEPLRLANILVHMDYGDDAQREAAISLVSGMPNEVLASLLEWSFAHDYERMRPFYEILARGAGKRIVQMAESNVEHIRIELLIPVMWVMRVVGEGKFAKARASLVKYKSIPVRTAALEWYSDHLPPEEVGVVVQAIFEPQPSIQRAALQALKRQRPHAARPMLESALNLDAFIKLPMDQKKRVCQAYAYVAREHGLPVLENLMRTKPPLILLNNDPILEVIEAAVWGILAIDVPKATQVIKDEASGWPSARTQICKRVLKKWSPAP